MGDDDAVGGAVAVGLLVVVAVGLGVRVGWVGAAEVGADERAGGRVVVVRVVGAEERVGALERVACAVLLEPLPGCAPAPAPPCRA